MSCVRSLVSVIQHGSCFGCCAALPRKENRQRIVRMLLFHHRKSMVLPSRRGGVPVFRRPCGRFSSRAGGQRHRRRVAHAAAGVVSRPDVDLAVEEGAGGQHDGLGHEADAELGHAPHDLVALDDQVVAGLLKMVRLGWFSRRERIACLAQHAVGLGAGGADRRAFRGVQDAELDAGLVGGRRHGAAQRIEPRAPDGPCRCRRSTDCSSSPQRVEVVGQQQRVRPRRAAASAASVPAWPPPTTMTSKRWDRASEGDCCSAVADRRFYVRSLKNHRIAAPVPCRRAPSPGQGKGVKCAAHGLLPAPAISVICCHEHEPSQGHGPRQ